MNKVILLGRLTKDVELRYTQHSNMPVSNFTLAVNRKFVKEGEERQADFFNIIAWNKMAEATSKYLKKGTQVLITGKLQNRNWDDEQGNKHYVTEVILEEIDFIESIKKETIDASILDGTNPNMSNSSLNENTEIFTDDNDDLPF